MTTSYGRVTGVAYDGDLIALGMGDVVVNMNSVLAIHGDSELPKGDPDPDPETPTVPETPEEGDKETA